MLGGSGGKTASRKLSPAAFARMRWAGRLSSVALALGGVPPFGVPPVPPGCPGPVPVLSPLILRAGERSFSPAPPPGCARIVRRPVDRPGLGAGSCAWLLSARFGPGLAACAVIAATYSAMRAAPGSRAGQSSASILRQRLRTKHRGGHCAYRRSSGAAAPVPPPPPGRCLIGSRSASGCVRSWQPAGHHINNTKVSVMDKVIFSTLPRMLKALYIKGFPAGLGDQ